MTWVVEASGSVTTDGTEQTLAETGGTPNLPTGPTYELNLDHAALVGTDEITLRIYTKARTADTARLYDSINIDGNDTADIVKSIGVPTAVYVKFTVQRTAGTDRTHPWAVYKR